MLISVITSITRNYKVVVSDLMGISFMTSNVVRQRAWSFVEDPAITMENPTACCMLFETTKIALKAK